MTDACFNLRAAASTILNILCVQLLLGFIVSYYIVDDAYTTFESDPFENLSNIDNRKLVVFYVGAALSCPISAVSSTVLGVRWSVLVSSLLLAALLPVVSVVQTRSALSGAPMLSLLCLVGVLFGALQTSIIQGACVVEVIAQRCVMGRFQSFSQICTLLGLLVGSMLSSGVGHPGSLPSTHTFIVSLAAICVTSALTFFNMYSRLQEGGVRERVVAWARRRGSRTSQYSRYTVRLDRASIYFGLLWFALI